MKNGLKTLAMWLIIGIIFIVVVSAITENSETKMDYSKLLTEIANGKVESIKLNYDGDKAYVMLQNSKTEKEVNIPSLDSFMNEVSDYLKNGNIELTQNSESILVTILGLLSPFAIVIVFFLFWILFMGSPAQGGGNKTMSFGKSRARMMGTTEIVANSIDTDGVKQGFNIDLLNRLCDAVNVPIIASGGAGCKEDFLELFKSTNADAGLAASIFHFGEVQISDLKQYLLDNKINMRL